MKINTKKMFIKNKKIEEKKITKGSKKEKKKGKPKISKF